MFDKNKVSGFSLLEVLIATAILISAGFVLSDLSIKYFREMNFFLERSVVQSEGLRVSRQLNSQFLNAPRIFPAETGAGPLPEFRGFATVSAGDNLCRFYSAAGKVHFNAFRYTTVLEKFKLGTLLTSWNEQKAGLNTAPGDFIYIPYLPDSDIANGFASSVMNREILIIDDYGKNKRRYRVRLIEDFSPTQINPQTGVIDGTPQTYNYKRLTLDLPLQIDGTPVDQLNVPFGKGSLVLVLVTRWACAHKTSNSLIVLDELSSASQTLIDGSVYTLQQVRFALMPYLELNSSPKKYLTGIDSVTGASTSYGNAFTNYAASDEQLRRCVAGVNLTLEYSEKKVNLDGLQRKIPFEEMVVVLNPNPQVSGAIYVENGTSSYENSIYRFSENLRLPNFIPEIPVACSSQTLFL